MSQDNWHKNHKIEADGLKAECTCSRPLLLKEGKQEPLVYTVAQLLERLGGTLGRSSVYEAIRLKELRCIRRGRRILIPARAISEWLAGS